MIYRASYDLLDNGDYIYFPLEGRDETHAREVALSMLSDVGIDWLNKFDIYLSVIPSVKD